MSEIQEILKGLQIKTKEIEKELRKMNLKEFCDKYGTHVTIKDVASMLARK